jgi:hypothetical protein
MSSITAKPPDFSALYKFPRLVVFEDAGKAYWVANGFHRYRAAFRLKRENIECEVRKGGLRQAILYACGANAAHGLRRTNGDKRQAVTLLKAHG